MPCSQAKPNKKQPNQTETSPIKSNKVHVSGPTLTRKRHLINRKCCILTPSSKTSNRSACLSLKTQRWPGSSRLKTQPHATFKCYNATHTFTHTHLQTHTQGGRSKHNHMQSGRSPCKHPSSFLQDLSWSVVVVFREILCLIGYICSDCLY